MKTVMRVRLLPPWSDQPPEARLALRWILLLVSGLTADIQLIILPDKVLEPWLSPYVLTVIAIAAIPWILIITRRAAVREISTFASCTILLASLVMLLLMPQAWVLDPRIYDPDPNNPFSCLQAFCEGIPMKPAFSTMRILSTIPMVAIAYLRLAIITVLFLRDRRKRNV
jgi:hypothetical protein